MPGGGPHGAAAEQRRAAGGAPADDGGDGLHQGAAQQGQRPVGVAGGQGEFHPQTGCGAAVRAFSVGGSSNVCCRPQIREGCPPLLREAQALLPPLEEMEKNISGFYQALEKAGAITGSSQPGGGSDFRQKCQVVQGGGSAAPPTEEALTASPSSCRSWRPSPTAAGSA